MRLTMVFTAIMCVAGSLLAAIPAMPSVLDREQVIAASNAVTATVYPNAKTATVSQLEYTTYVADGTGVEWVEFYVKALTEDGTKELCSCSTGFLENFSEAEFQLAEVIHPDATSETLSLKDCVSISTNNSMTDANIYDPKHKQLVLSVPSIAKGDMLHVIYATKNIKVRIPNSFTSMSIFEETSPLCSAKVVIEGPNALPLKSVAILDEIPNTVTSTKETLGTDRFRYTWVAEQIPQMYEEENMPEIYTQLQRLAVSTFASWEEISQWYWGLVKGHLETTPAIREKVAELIDGCPDEASKMRAIFRFVSQEIRYMGIIAEDAAPGYEPHDVAMTFDNRYGVCRDKGVLLVAMLREAGFEAYPVLINAGAKLDATVPLPYFNHAIVAIDRGGNDYQLLDPTDETTRDLFPTYLSDCSFLVARPEGDKLRLSPVPSPKENLMSISTVATLAADGALQLEAKADFGGINDNIYRSLLIRSQPEELRRLMDRLLKNIAPGATLESVTFSPENAQDITQPLTMTLTARVKDFAQTDEAGNTLVSLPLVSRVFGYVNFIFDGLDQPTRKYDWVITTPCAVQETLTLKQFKTLGKVVLMPQDPIYKSNGASYTMQAKQVGEDWVITREVELSHKTYSPEDYLAMRNFVRLMTQADRQKPLFKKDTTADADAIMLSSTKAVTLSQHLKKVTTAITNEKQILTYTGKKSYAELKLDYTPAFQTLTLGDLFVIRADGEKQTVVPNEINELDGDGNATSPRYPGSKRTVVTFPAVEVGATLHAAYTRTTESHFPLTLTYIFGSEMPVQNETFTLTVPLEDVDNLRIATRRISDFAIDTSVVTNAATVVYTWTAKNIPALRSERATPQAELWQPTIFIAEKSAAPDSFVPEVLQQIDAKMGTGASAAIAKARELTADCTLQEDKIRVLQSYLRMALRTAGPAWSALPYGTWSTPDETLAAGYGNQADTIILWGAMLRAVGVPCTPVMLSSLTEKETALVAPLLAMDEVPTMAMWQSFYLQLADGRMVGHEMRFDEPGSGAPENGEMLTMTGERVPYRSDSTLQTATKQIRRIVVTPTGDCTISDSEELYGHAAGILREFNKEATPKDRERRIAAMADAMATGAEPCSELTIAARQYPVFVRLAVEVKSYASRQGQVLSLPLAVVNMPPAIDGLKRQTPIWINEQPLTVQQVEVYLPKGAKVLLKPEPFAYTLAGGGEASLTLEQDTLSDGSVCLRYTSTLKRMPGILNAYCLPAIQELTRRLSAPTMHTLIFELPKE